MDRPKHLSHLYDWLLDLARALLSPEAAIPTAAEPEKPVLTLAVTAGFGFMRKVSSMEGRDKQGSPNGSRLRRISSVCSWQEQATAAEQDERFQYFVDKVCKIQAR